jgi:RNA polymerase sigma-B factor
MLHIDATSNYDRPVMTAAALTTSSERDRVIASFLPLVHEVARRFARSADQREELVQVGSLALVRAAGRLDAGRTASSAAYLARCVEGEVRHHLRDRSAVVRIPRGADPDTAPTATARRPVDIADADPASDESPDEVACARAFVHRAAAALDEGERRALALRYYLDLTQQETATALGVSQAHVSRLLKRALRKMERRVGPVVGAEPARYAR